jgi:exodeoxyribonuclease VII small subunit
VAKSAEAKEKKQEDLTFDEALRQLEELAAKLEEGDIPLEGALQVYERAVGLFSLCRGRLDTMEQRIDLLTEDLEGSLKTEPAALPVDDGEND